MGTFLCTLNVTGRQTNTDNASIPKFVPKHAIFFLPFPSLVSATANKMAAATAKNAVLDMVKSI